MQHGSNGHHQQATPASPWLPSRAASLPDAPMATDWLAAWQPGNEIADAAHAAVVDWCQATARGEMRALVIWSSAARSAEAAARGAPGRPAGSPEWQCVTGYGAGKTHLARAACQWLKECVRVDGLGVSRSRRPKFWTAVDMLAAIKESYRDGSMAFDWQLLLSDTVVLDDFGKQYVRGESSAWAAEQFYRLIDGLYKGQHSLLMTSNLDPDELEVALGGASASRLLEMARGGAGFVDMSLVPDWRAR